MMADSGGDKLCNSVLDMQTDHDRDFDCGVTREDGKVTPNEDYTNHILKLLQEVLHFE